MRLVEFTGPCGCGKTTLLNYFQQALRKQGVNALSREEAIVKSLRNLLGIPGNLLFLIPRFAAEKLSAQIFRLLQYKYRIKFIDTHLDIFYQAIDSQMQRRVSVDEKRRAVRWFLIFGGIYVFFDENLDADDVVLFSEGFAHKVVNLFSSESEQPDKEALARYLACVPEIALLISVSADTEICEMRMRQRGNTPLRLGNDETTIFRFIENSASTINAATRLLEERGTPVETLDNSKSLKEACTSLEDLASHYASRLKPHTSFRPGNG